MIVNISEAKANRSKLVNMAYHGGKVVIAKNNLPLVDLVIYQPECALVARCPLLTLDTAMKQIATQLGIVLLEEKT